MTVKQVAASQRRAIVDRATGLARDLPMPPEGWIAVVRKALGMSGSQLGRRVGVKRSRVSQAEHAERDGAVTLRTMHGMATAMGCRFVYAIVPEQGGIEDLIAGQARRKARRVVARASQHMALEDQALSREQEAEEVERLAQEMIRQMHTDLWSDE